MTYSRDNFGIEWLDDSYFVKETDEQQYIVVNTSETRAVTMKNEEKMEQIHLYCV